MENTEKKKQFIKMRAEGQSYGKISAALHVSRQTLTKWNKELAAEVSDTKKQELAELVEMYGMTKEARIKSYGDTLAKIETALQGVDLTTIDPAKLLDFKLKYTEALKAEYQTLTPVTPIGEINPQSIMKAWAGLLTRVQAGEVTTEQAQREGGVLAQLMKAFDMVEIQARMTEWEMLLQSPDNGRRAAG